MQISLKWVNELVNIEAISLEELIEKLTLGGFEVEEILEIEIEKKRVPVLEISTTANRSDSLSIQGLALEIAALLQTQLKTSNYTNSTFKWNKRVQKLPQHNLQTNDCTGFQALILKNLTSFDSPKWVKQKLIASGIAPENTINDFQNYILLETGYPVEVYDLDQIFTKLNTTNFDLTLTYPQSGEKFFANNEITYPLDNSTLILKANQLPISIAGIASHQNYNCSKTTKSLLIEGSIFNAAKIRQQSRILGLRTTRSVRYEKSLNRVNLLTILSRFVDLLKIKNPNLVCQLHTSNLPCKQKIKTIELYYTNVKEILGPVKDKLNQYILPVTVTKCLERLQFDVDYHEQTTTWTISIPEFRQNDIEREIDLIEEIGRLYGFNNFTIRLPSLIKIGTEDFTYKVRKKLTSSFIGSGLNELVQYSLVSKTTYLTNEIELVNPLVKDYANLRVSLLPNLIKAVEENSKKSNLILEGFEYGHVFSRSKSKTIQEHEVVAGIFGGSPIKVDWADSSQSLTWFEGKSKLDEVFKKLNLLMHWQFYKPVKERNILHPYRAAELHLADNSILGIFGQIHPLLAKQLNLSTRTYLFEVNVERIKEQIKKNKLSTYQEYSSYPKIVKDLSFVINQNISFQTVKQTIQLNGSKFLTEINLLDEYRGPSIPVNHSSLCVQLIFQSDRRTLETRKIEKILNHIRAMLMNKFDATLRT